ncbi:hypothetical protein MAR_010629 [Mya arenaria]|uniref:Uncharacterized protein n=1 Tax=Mya arenaria TaxID=6604 RepID=A0ABY7E534_MYAAR|nr:hypothetical protein MAR_010629 [Mya arenaria]
MVGLLFLTYEVYTRLNAADSICFPNAADGYARSEYKGSVVENYTLPRRLSAITNDTHCPDGFWKDDELTWENSTAIPTRIAEYEQFVKAKEWTSGKSDDKPVFITGLSAKEVEEQCCDIITHESPLHTLVHRLVFDIQT